MLIDLIEQFAPHCNPIGVDAIFNAPDNPELSTRYAEVRNRIAQKTAAATLPPLVEALVFGADFEEVKRRVDTVSGVFMFLDYGEINFRRDVNGRYVEDARLAVTIAVRKKRTNADLVSLALLSDDCLDRLLELRRRMLAAAELSRSSGLQHLTDDHEVVPFSAPELASVGWTLLYHRRAYDEQCARGRIR